MKIMKSGNLHSLLGQVGKHYSKGTHNKSINKTVVWGYSIATGMRQGLKRRRTAGDKSIYGKAEYNGVSLLLTLSLFILSLAIYGLVSCCPPSL